MYGNYGASWGDAFGDIGAADQRGGPWLGSGGYVYSRLSDGSYRIEPGSPAAVGKTYPPTDPIWAKIHDDLTKTGFQAAPAGGPVAATSREAKEALDALAQGITTRMTTDVNLPAGETSGGVASWQRAALFGTPLVVGAVIVAAIVGYVMFGKKKRRNPVSRWVRKVVI